MIKRLQKERSETANPAEKEKLKKEIQAAEEKHSRDVSLEAGANHVMLGSLCFNEPSSERYRAFGDPAQLSKMREAVKNSRVVVNYAYLPPYDRAAELARTIRETDKAEYGRLFVDLAGAVDRKIPAAAAPANPQNAPVAGAPAKVDEKQAGQKAVVPGGH